MKPELTYVYLDVPKPIVTALERIAFRSDSKFESREIALEALRSIGYFEEPKP